MADERLVALQELLSLLDAGLAEATPRELAGLSREKRQVMAEVEALRDTKGSAIDELDRRRTDRRAKATVGASAGRGRKQRSGTGSG